MPAFKVNKTSSHLHSFPCNLCDRVLKSSGGLRQHQNSKHPILSSDSDSEDDDGAEHHSRQSTFQYHPHLNGLSHDLDGFLSNFASAQCGLILAKPVDAQGDPLPRFMNPPPLESRASSSSFAPFDNRLSFEWCHYHFVEMQSSKSKIARGLDLWLATKLEALKSNTCEPVPWKDAANMHKTIDAIQEGGAPFETVQFRYSGPMPSSPPSWMTAVYDLNVRNSRTLLHDQLANKEFDGSFNTTPYRQFMPNGERVWSDLHSGDWAWQQAVCFARTH